MISFYPKMLLPIISDSTLSHQILDIIYHWATDSYDPNVSSWWINNFNKLDLLQILLQMLQNKESSWNLTEKLKNYKIVDVHVGDWLEKTMKAIRGREI